MMGFDRSASPAAKKQAAHRHKQAKERLSQIPQVHGDGYSVYQGDALQIVPRLQDTIDAVVTDPPYGIDFDCTKARLSLSAPKAQGLRISQWTAKIQGDDQPFDPTPWVDYPEVILWGFIHFYHHLPPGGGELTWDKRDGSTSDHFGDCESAWIKKRIVQRFLSIKNRGYTRMGEENLTHGPRLHPFQKPVDVMQWCLDFITGHTVLDPYMGSGSTGVACLRAGKAFIGIEIDAGYFQTACQRLQKEAAQPRLFSLQPAANADDHHAPGLWELFPVA
jgi:site-specific DNA-methyltransferase (adenine-specific)